MWRASAILLWERLGTTSFTLAHSHSTWCPEFQCHSCCFTSSLPLCVRWVAFPPIVALYKSRLLMFCTTDEDLQIEMSCIEWMIPLLWSVITCSRITDELLRSTPALSSLDRAILLYTTQSCLSRIIALMFCPFCPRCCYRVLKLSYYIHVPCL